jgi:nucleotide-binding universal stress UspA family protein
MERTVIEFKRILCPVDFSDSSTRVLAHAAALARWYGAQLTVLHVVSTFDPMQVQAELGVPVQIVNPMTREEVVGGMRPSRACRCVVVGTPDC